MIRADIYSAKKSASEINSWSTKILSPNNELNALSSFVFYKFRYRWWSE